jgi:hypothetical protein
MAAVLAVAVAFAPAAQAGSVRVPLDRADPGLGHVTVRYGPAPHRPDAAAARARRAFEGGPGYGSIGSGGQAFRAVSPAPWAPQG